MKREQLRVCKEQGCHFVGRHYSNCPECAGLGMYESASKPGELFAVSAAEAMMGSDARKLHPCPFCKSTNVGITATSPTAPEKSDS